MKHEESAGKPRRRRSSMWKTVLIVGIVGIVGCAVWASALGGGRVWMPVVLSALCGMLVNLAWRRIP